MEAASLLTRLGFETDAKPLEAIEEKLEGLRHRLEFLGAVEVVKGLYELAERFAGLGEQIETAAVSAGITTDAFQRLTYAASQNSVGQDELSGAMARLNRTLYEAKTGSEQALKSFAAAGVSREQIMGYRNSADALHGLANSFASMSDPVKKQAVAMQLMGRGSYNMVKLLNQGGKGLDAFGDEAQRMGAVLDEKAIEKLAKLEDTMSGFFGLIKKIAAGVAAMFAPAIIQLVHSFENLYAANQKVFMLRVRDWMHNIVYAVVYVGTWVKLLIQDFMNFAKAHPVLMKRTGELALALGAASLAFGGLAKILAVGKGLFADLTGVLGTLKGPLSLVGLIGKRSFGLMLSAASLFKGALVWILERLALLAVEAFPALGEALMAFAATLSATPVGLFAAAVAAAVVAVHDLWAVFVEGKAFKDTWLGQLWDKLELLPGKLRGVVNWMRGEAPDTPIFGGPAGAPGATGAAGKAGADGQGILGRLGGLFAGKDSPAAQAQQGMATLAAAAAPPAALLSPMAAAAAPAAAGPTSITVNAPMSISVPEGTPPRAVQAAVQQGVREHLDQQNREAQRQVRTARVY